MSVPAEQRAGEYRCICDPNDLFEPPSPIPRAVEGCTAHRARYAAQKFTEETRGTDEQSK